MTTKRTYSCNLCLDAVGDGTGVGLLYRYNGDSKGISFVVPSNAENHICQKCLSWVEAEIIESREIAQKRASVDLPIG